jgi:hypothetical protein
MQFDAEKQQITLEDPIDYLVVHCINLGIEKPEIPRYGIVCPRGATELSPESTRLLLDGVRKISNFRITQKKPGQMPGQPHLESSNEVVELWSQACKYVDDILET